MARRDDDFVTFVDGQSDGAVHLSIADANGAAAGKILRIPSAYDCQLGLGTMGTSFGAEAAQVISANLGLSLTEQTPGAYWFGGLAVPSGVTIAIAE